MWGRMASCGRYGRVDNPPQVGNLPHMTRRELLAMGGAAAVAAPESIMVHEHVLVDFTGGGKWDSEEAFRAALPKFEEARYFGCRRLQECTPAFLGRDPRLLRSLA